MPLLPGIPAARADRLLFGVVFIQADELHVFKCVVRLKKYTKKAPPKRGRWLRGGLFQVAKQALQLLLDMVKRVRGPVCGVKIGPDLTDPGQDRFKTGFYVGLHGYTGMRSFFRTAAVTIPPSPTTTRSPAIWITS